MDLLQSPPPALATGGNCSMMNAEGCELSLAKVGPLSTAAVVLQTAGHRYQGAVFDKVQFVVVTLGLKVYCPLVFPAKLT